MPVGRRKGSEAGEEQEGRQGLRERWIIGNLTARPGAHAKDLQLIVGNWKTGFSARENLLDVGE